MTYTSHVLLQFGGRLFETEQWSCGLRISLYDTVWSPTVDVGVHHDQEDWCEGNVDAAKDKVASWFTSSQASINNKARLDFVKLNSIGPDGKYTNEENTTVFFYTATTAPTGAETTGFPQLSMCCSLLTDLQRGHGSRGRIYTPTGMLAIAANGHISATQTGLIGQAMANLISEINNLPGLDTYTPAVVVASNFRPLHRVTRVGCGDVIDTQRRRRENLPEAYSTYPVVP